MVRLFAMAEEVREFGEDITEDFKGALVGAEPADEVGRVVLEELVGVLGVDLHPGAEDRFVHVVSAAFDEGAPFHPLDQFFDIRGLKDDNMHDLDVFFEELGLVEGAGDAIEKEELLVGEVAVGGNEPFDKVVPDANGDVIRKEVAFACIGMVDLACRGLWGDTPKNIA